MTQVRFIPDRVGVQFDGTNSQEILDFIPATYTNIVITETLLSMNVYVNDEYQGAWNVHIGDWVIREDGQAWGLRQNADVQGRYYLPVNPI